MEGITQPWLLKTPHLFCLLAWKSPHSLFLLRSDAIYNWRSDLTSQSQMSNCCSCISGTSESSGLLLRKSAYSPPGSLCYSQSPGCPVLFLPLGQGASPSKDWITFKLHWRKKITFASLCAIQPDLHWCCLRTPREKNTGHIGCRCNLD